MFHGYGWGCNQVQQLSLIENENQENQNQEETILTNISSPNPLPLFHNENIVYVCAGEEKTCFVASNNDIFVYGKDITKHLKHSLDREDEMIISASNGQNHFIFRSASGLVFGYESNFNYELGFDNSVLYTVEKPTPIPFFEENNLIIKNAVCGAESSYFVTNQGELYVCGTNLYGQLGTGNTNTEMVPSIAQIDVARVFSGSESYHHFYMTGDKKLFACGYGKYGQLGLGSKGNQKKPSELKNFREKTIQDISCGYRHSLMLIEGKVYSCGASDYNGQGQSSHCTKFKIIQELISQTIVQICAGKNHSLVVTSEGVLYTFGSNSHQQLGLKEKSKNQLPFQPLPVRINLSDLSNVKASDIGLACGATTSFIWNSDFNSLLKDFQVLYESQEFCDLKIKNNKIKLNSSLLEARIHQPVTESIITELENFSLEELKIFVEWVYLDTPPAKSLMRRFTKALKLKKASKLQSDIRYLFRDNDSKDFSLIVGEERKVKVHKLILLVRTKKFAKRLSADYTIDKYDIQKENFSFSAIRGFVEYLYTDDLDGINEPTEEIKTELKTVKRKFGLSKFSNFDRKIVTM
ncbi:btk-binding protein-related [Anaeramoeba flamelloides]|uniref:Btk-binding protein-related n=1 Tax=Anaeramoeba flamelloides TaxID=1746091 RepID=A0AAV7Z9N3_9EUKA|nr:btk-binding protein-related [Anaeramoeba flamelloides]